MQFPDAAELIATCTDRCESPDSSKREGMIRIFQLAEKGAEHEFDRIACQQAISVLMTTPILGRLNA